MRVGIRAAVAVLLVAVAAIWWCAKPVQVQESHGPRWEYCSVTTGSGADKSRSVSRVVYFSPDPARRSEPGRTDAVDGANPMESFRRAIARLGAEGWELVTVVGDVPVAYFKRPLQ